MPFLRFIVACLSALACLGTSYAAAGGGPPRLPGQGAKPAAVLRVAVCAGEVSPDLCGPRAFSKRQLGGRFPPIAKQAGGIISLSRPLKIECPGKPPRPDLCEAHATRPFKVTIRAWVTRDGYHKFEEWKGNGCSGTAQVCTLRVAGVKTVTAVISGG